MNAPALDDEMVLGWELLLSAAAEASFPDFARELGLSHQVPILVAVSRPFLDTDDWSSANLRKRVRSARARLESTGGYVRLAELDEWVAVELTNPFDAAVHYVAAIDLLLGRQRASAPSLQTFGVPAWVEVSMRRRFRNRGRWRRLFDFQSGCGPRNGGLDWETVGTCLRATADRRAFRAFWQDVAARAEPPVLEGVRKWAIATLRPQGRLDLPLPATNGSFVASCR